MLQLAAKWSKYLATLWWCGNMRERRRAGHRTAVKLLFEYFTTLLPSIAQSVCSPSDNYEISFIWRAFGTLYKLYFDAKEWSDRPQTDISETKCAAGLGKRSILHLSHDQLFMVEISAALEQETPTHTQTHPDIAPNRPGPRRPFSINI